MRALIILALVSVSTPFFRQTAPPTVGNKPAVTEGPYELPPSWDGPGHQILTGNCGPSEPARTASVTPAGATPNPEIAIPGQQIMGLEAMPEIRRYVEWMSRGRRTGRVVYVIRDKDVPVPVPGAEWQLDTKFNAAEDLLRDPELSVVIKAALENGAEMVHFKAKDSSYPTAKPG